MASATPARTEPIVAFHSESVPSANVLAGTAAPTR